MQEIEVTIRGLYSPERKYRIEARDEASVDLDAVKAEYRREFPGATISGTSVVVIGASVPSKPVGVKTAEGAFARVIRASESESS